MKRLYSAVAGFAFAFMLVISGSALAFASEGSDSDSGTLRVAFPESEGFTMVDEDGNRYGLVVDYLTEIAKYTGWEYEYIDVDGNIMMDEFLKGKFDLAGGTFYVPGMEQYFGYPDYSCGTSKSVLFARWDDASIRGYDFADLNGKTIAVSARATEKIRRLEDFLMIENLDCTIQKYTIDQFVDGSLAYLLESGEVDLLLGNAGDNDGAFRTVATIDGQAHYIVTAADDEGTLKELNWALERILESNPSFAKERYEANFPDENINAIRLSESEISYIERKGKVTVAVPAGYDPFCFGHNAEGRRTGMTHDFLDAIAEFSGLEISYVATDSYAEACAMVQRGEVDMLGFFLGGEWEAADAGFALSSPYAFLSDLIVRNKSVTYPSDGLTYVVIEGTEPPLGVTASEKVLYAKDEHEALNMVNKGKADVAFGLSVQMENALQQSFYSNVVPVSLTERVTAICFALPRPADPDLLTIVNKGLNSMSSAERTAIIDENQVSVGRTSFTLADVFYTHPILSVATIIAVLVLFFAVVIVSLRSRLKAADLRLETERAEMRERAKSEFLSRMSHEIRTPMNAIAGTADMLALQKDDPEALDANLARLRASCDYLLSLLNDILDSSSVENNMMDVSSEPFALGTMIDELHDMMQAQADARSIDFRVRVDAVHADVAGDSIRLKQVLSNLLSNAFKFTPEGGIVELSVEETAFADGEVSYSFKVSDNGVGISSEDQERIFDAFAQIGDSVSKSRGTGLGLPLCRSLVQLMGGDGVSVRSEPGSGSEFGFLLTFPVALSESDCAAPADRALFRGKGRFLLVEDDSINASIATNLLEMHGAQVTWVANGKQAVEAFAASDPDEYQIVLMDVSMPVMNGMEAARAIRAMSRADARSVPIVAMTANAFQESREAAREAGMNGFVTKPLDLTELFKVMNELLGE